MKLFGNFLALIVITSMALAQLAMGGNGSSGGGNLLPKDRISENQFTDVLSKAKLVSEAYFDFVQNYPENSKLPLQVISKLFQGENSVQDMLRRSKIVIAKDEPCFSENQEKDASYTETSGYGPVICISQERITSKINKLEATTQIWALVAHEISHSMGTTEAEAELIQATAANTMVAGAYEKIRDARLNGANNLLSLRTIISTLRKTISKSLSSQEVEELLPELLMESQGAPDSAEGATAALTILTSHLSPISKKGVAEVALLPYRVLILNDSLCAVSHPSKIRRAKCKERLNIFFSEENEISTADLARALGIPAAAFSSGTLIHSVDQTGLQIQSAAIIQLIDSILNRINLSPVPEYSAG